MPTQFPAAPRACVKRARVLRARATAAYIAKKNWQKNSAPTLKNIYILKGCVVCTLLHILLLHIPWLFLKRKILFGEIFDLKNPHFLDHKSPQKNLFFFPSIFFLFVNGNRFLVNWLQLIIRTTTLYAFAALLFPHFSRLFFEAPLRYWHSSNYIYPHTISTWLNTLVARYLAFVC